MKDFIKVTGPAFQSDGSEEFYINPDHISTIDKGIKEGTSIVRLICGDVVSVYENSDAIVKRIKKEARKNERIHIFSRK